MTWENRVIFEVSSADPDADLPAWVDLTLRIRDVSQVIDVNIGRQNDLETSEPTQWTALLDNSDDALTFGSLTSPYPWWGPGRKCRLRERIGSSVVDIATGYLQIPTESLTTVGIEQRVQVSIVDRLGRLASGAPFISTLAEHIRYNGRSALRYYWPCFDDAKEFTNVLSTDGLPHIAFSTSSVSGILPTAGTTATIPQGGQPVLADDAFPVVLTAATGTSGGLEAVAATNDFRVPGGYGVPVAAGQIVTLIGWYRPDMPASRDHVFLINATDTQGFLNVVTNNSAGQIVLVVSGTLSGGVTGPILPNLAWFPLAVRYGWDTGVIELWVGGNRYVGSMAGVPAGPNLMSSAMTVCSFYAGAFADVQFYVGSASEFTFTDYLAQFSLAQLGMERQTTGERIRTILSYAGVRGGEMNIDTGTSVMQRASLTTQRPLDAIRDAERTEQGLLYVDGAGIIQFRDRRSLYNI